MISRARDWLLRDVEELLNNSKLDSKEIEKITTELLIRHQDLERDPEKLKSFRSSEELDELAKKASQNQEFIPELWLYDERTKTIVTHRDVGIGISQVLPVIVYAYANRNKLIAIEQPEIHLHPAMQAELGDVFIESALGENKNTFILETHSEHLIFRIMRRMRETFEDNYPKGNIHYRRKMSLYYTSNQMEIKVLSVKCR